ncbi:hypothetical protein N8987_03255 [Crocinitomix sp.]|nr:hypothetical protein [Crocinitomix sp.]
MKIFNKNYNDPSVTKEIETIVGKPFSFRERLKRRGIGSTKLHVLEMSENLRPYFDKSVNLVYVSIEQRPTGMIVYMKGNLNDYCWAIPFYHLSIFQSDFYSIHADGAFLKLDLKSIYPHNAKFFERLQLSKANYQEDTYTTN